MKNTFRFIGFMVIIFLFVFILPESFSLNSTSAAVAQSNGGIFLPLILTPGGPSEPPIEPPSDAPARVNLPLFDFWHNAAIAWFGRVNPSENYADLRMAYKEEALLVRLHIFDRRVWYDETPSMNELTDWDAATLYLYPEANPPTSLDDRAFKFVAQYNWWEPRQEYQASYQGNGSVWQAASIPFTSTAAYQGDVPNNDGDDRGWVVSFEVPYTSLDLSGTPPEGTFWGIAVALHDRDEGTGSPLPDKTWPEVLDPQNPSTWNQIRYGLPGYQSPQATNLQTINIRHKLNGADVPDGHVGGSTNCGDPFNPDFFNGWGDASYPGATQVNVQNQGNLGDWPCFSKYYVTFPLNQIPPGKVIVSAELVMHQFGNSDPSQAYASLIQVLTVSQDLVEVNLSWNNAPPAVENVSQAVVDPLPSYPGVPGVERRWEVSRAAAQAYGASQPLRLALYDADIAMHSGKYFYSSDVDDYMPEARPLLLVTYGDPQ